MTPYSLLFFGGEISVGMDEDQEVVTVDHWIKFKCRNTVAILVQVYFLQVYSSDTWRLIVRKPISLALG